MLCAQLRTVQNACRRTRMANASAWISETLRGGCIRLLCGAYRPRSGTQRDGGIGTPTRRVWQLLCSRSTDPAHFHASLKTQSAHYARVWPPDVPLVPDGDRC